MPKKFTKQQLKHVVYIWSKHGSIQKKDVWTTSKIPQIACLLFRGFKFVCVCIFIKNGKIICFDTHFLELVGCFNHCSPVGRPSSSYRRTAEPQWWCFSSLWVWEALLPLPWLFTLSQINIYHNWKGKCMLLMRHKLMLVDGNMERWGVEAWHSYFFGISSPITLGPSKMLFMWKQPAIFGCQRNSEAISFKNVATVKTRWI